MSSFEELVWTRTTLDGPGLAHLRRLAASWRPVADLSFSDLLLLAPVLGEDGHRFVVLAQVRSTTGQTIYPADMVGAVVDEVERPLVARCWRERRAVEGDTTALDSTERSHLQCIPVGLGDDLVGVVTRERTMIPFRRPGEMERHYHEAYERFARMIEAGSFPFRREEVELEAAPRVSDGVILLDADTRITFASPNAMSSLHRMGIHAYTKGSLLREVGLEEAVVGAALRSHLPADEEIERGDVSIMMRVLPLLAQSRPVGAVMLIRDVSDLRRRDRMLISKDATIREIHHRVKNNLQTIASLLRLQGRRLSSREARAALEESERRIRSIAIVHETLSRDAGDVVDFDEIVGPLVRVVEETLAVPGHTVRFHIEGDAGRLPGEVATPLAVVLNELMQNAADHAFPPPRTGGSIDVRLGRAGPTVVVEVSDDGVGLPERFSIDSSTGLGLSIVEALVTGELGGSIELRDEGGTRVEVRVPVEAPRAELETGPVDIV